MASPYPVGDFNLLFFASFPGALRWGSKPDVIMREPRVRLPLDCVAKLPLMRIANHDSVGGDGIGGSGA
jgi:hypothetical protein